MSTALNTTAAPAAPLTPDEALTQHRRESWFSIPDSRDYNGGFLRGHRYATAAPATRCGQFSAQCVVADIASPVDVHFSFEPAEPGYPAEVTVEAVYLRGVDILVVLDEGRLDQVAADILEIHEESQPRRRFA